MKYESPAPERIPEKGFYYHYKHDPAGPINNCAYEVMGVAHHTEDDCRPEDAYMVVYRPVYESYVYKLGKFFDVRPLAMFMEEVEKGGKRLPRFIRIADPAVTSELTRIRDAMYND